MAKLNPNAQKWVDALRSGKYKQAHDSLRTGDSFCCLGVACEVAKTELSIEWNEREEIDGRGGTLPKSVCKWLGFNEDNSSGKIQSLRADLTEYNDDRDYTFEQIADLIEAHAEELGVAHV